MIIQGQKNLKICIVCKTRFSGTGWECPACRSIPPVREGIRLLAPFFGSREGFDPELFVELSKVEGKHFWFRSRNRLISWALRHYFPGARDFLEVGCGTGFVLAGIRKALPTIKISGSDIFHSALALAKERVPEVCFLQMDACAIPFEEEFDVVGVFDVLEHIPDDRLALRQIYQTVRPGGGVILTVPQHPWMWSRSDEQARHIRRYKMGELESKVADAGFRTIRRTSFVSLLLPLMMVLRLLRQGLQRSYDVMDELKVAEPLNTILELALGFELLLMRHGVNLPFGGSALLVARKDSGK